MKRSHDEIGRKKSLGALEFAAALNGDDARAVLSALRRFTKTSRRERRQALCENDESSSDEDESSSSEEDEMKDETLTKKRKKQEAWMEDTGSFNVPFVGTSVAKGDVGTVAAGQWPTGLLQAYLKASPMAVELTSGDLIPPAGHLHKRLLSNKAKHGKKASQAIYRAYLETLAELITAHVPITTLVRDFGIETTETDSHTPSSLTKDSIVSVILKERLGGIMLLINQETGGGKMMDHQLVANALRVLANLSATSLGAAREVTRALDSSLKDGILKSLLRSRKSVKKDEDTKVEGRGDESVRIESLRLATVLTEWQDSAITSYIATKGSRERKINAGILYLAVRLGLHDSVFNDGEPDEDGSSDDYVQVVARLLRAVRLLLLESDDISRRPMLSTRDLVDFFSGDALTHISHIACCAPSLVDSTPVRGTDTDVVMHSEPTTIEEAGIEGRRILFTFLADPSKSPFLARMKHSKADDNQVAHCAQQLVRAMMFLLQHCPSLSIQQFLIKCLQTTPTTVPYFFKMVTVPDAVHAFSYIARMGFIFRLIREVPPVSSCIGGDAYLDTEQVDRVVSSIIPSSLKRQILSKALKSSNALIVSEALKVIYALTDRYHNFITDIETRPGTEELRGLVTDAFLRRLPDIQSLLSVRTRFDPFTSVGDAKAGPIVIGQVCKVLDSFALYLPDVLNNAKFSWFKLLPIDAEAFCSTSPVLQYQLLHTLELVLGSQEEQSDSHRLSAATARLIMGIAMVAKNTRVYQKARSIAIKMIHTPSLCFVDSESSECIDYEISLWVDGITELCIDDFFSLLNSPANTPFQHSIAVAKAWKKANLDALMPCICFSPLMSASLEQIATGTSSEPFSLFTCQVVTKCLLYQRYPLLLASLIVNSLADIELDVHPANFLCRYARSLLSPDDWNARESMAVLDSLIQCIFTPNCLQNEMMRSLREETHLDLSRTDFSIAELNAAVRQCLHVAVVDSISADATKQSILQLRKLVPLLSQSESPGAARSRIDAILDHPLIKSGKYPPAELAYLNVASLSLPEEMLAEEPVQADGPPSQMRHIILLSLLNPLLPNQTPSQSAMREILRQVSRAILDENAVCFSAYASLALYWADNQAGAHCSLVPLDAALEAWRVIMNNCQPSNLIACRLAQRLGANLSRTMESTDPQRASRLYALLSKLPPSEVMKLGIRSKHMESCNSSEGPQCRQSVLSGLLSSNPAVFGVSFFQFLAQPESRHDAIRHLKEGFFDEEIAVLSRMDDVLAAPSFEEVRDEVIMRSLQALSSKPDIDEHGLISLLLIPGMLQSCHVDGLIDLACSSLGTKPKLMSSGIRLSQLSHKLLCSDNPECALRESKSRGRLASVVLIHDFRRLQLCLKSYFRSDRQEGRNESRNACLEALHQASGFITKGILFDDAVLVKEGPEATHAIVKSALKYGLSHAGDEGRVVSERCLRFVRLLIVEVSDPSSSLHVLEDHCVLLDPATILAMVVSHSNFYEILSSAATDEGADSNADFTVLELVRLMLVCTSMTRDTVLFESEMFSALLSVYNAGTTLIDITLRRLLHVYSGALVDRGMAANLPYMESLRWRGMTRAGESSLKTSGWDWLASGLDISRIRATLSQFPVHDRMKADSITDVESWLENSNDGDLAGMNTQEVNDMDSSDSSDEDSDASMYDNPNQEGVEIDNEKHATEIDVWKGPGTDMRYSPAFILPLILGALENLLSQTDSTLRDQKKYSFVSQHEDDSASVKEFVLLSQRLIERGALGLVLGSLCSECPSLRKVAVAAMAHIKKALDTKEARKLTSWRERPQLAMIVDSVQRGLAVRIAMRRDPHEQEPSKVVVPKLPALSAVFLARAALIIVKPGDSMFGPMNRYFLRLDGGRGAFQDTNRLPAFISLFCSSADEPGQSRRERMWALQLLKDSFVEPYCYRMIESCHAPELIMSNVGSIGTRQEDDQYGDTERILSLDTLTAILENGGRRAASHLIGRLGLLSWLRGQFVVDGLISVLPSLASRIAFLQLASKAVNMARLYVTDEDSDKHDLLMETKAFISDIVTLYDDSIHRGLTTALEQRGTAPSDSFATLFSDTLEALVNTVNEDGSSEDLGNIQKCGIPLDRALRVLQAVPESLKRALGSSLCIAPLRLDESVTENAARFSELVLSLLATNKVDKATSTTILKRVSLLVPLTERPLDTKSGIVDALLACRPACLQTSREVWFECLEAVVGKADDSEVPVSGESLRIAKAILGTS